MLSTFKEHLIGGSIRVYPPKRYVLLCGGEVADITDPVPASLRDGFLRGDFGKALKGAEVLQIEEIQEYFEKDSPYLDLVDFERDIAQICELVLLFSEGPGSFAELGSFSSFDEIFEKLLVVIQRRFLTRPSFITKGPVASLKRKFPNSVFTITDGPLGIAAGNLARLNCALLADTLQDPIQTRLKEADSRTTLNTKKYNHLCKAYVAILQEFYALNDLEIIELLTLFGFGDVGEQLERVSFCCSAIRWSNTTYSGFDRIHYALPGNEAAKLEFKSPLEGKIRRRNEFRQHWDKVDKNRVAAVDEGLRS